MFIYLKGSRLVITMQRDTKYVIPVIFENTDFMAVEKPAGLSVHNNEDPQNLLSVMLGQCEYKKLYPVHRLDKETSGIQLLAFNSASAKRISDEFQKQSIKKIYIGVLRGQLKEEKGMWIKQLSDKAEGRRNPSGFSSDRVPCRTDFKVIESTAYFSLCEFDLKTGRQHQIRKHAALANHCLVGDPRYGDKKYNKKMAELYQAERMFLHCAHLEVMGVKVDSPVPEDFLSLLAKS